MTSKIIYQDDTVVINNAEELFIALELAPSEVDEEILRQVGDDIPSLITSDEDFLKILQKVLGAQGQSKIPYLKCFGAKLTDVVTKGGTLKQTLAILAREEDQEYFIKALGEKGIKKSISSLEDIAGCLEWLYGKMDTFFIETIGWDYLIRYLTTGENLGTILKYLDEKEEKELLGKMGWDNILNCIQTPSDLTYLLAGMQSGVDRELIKKIDGKKLKDVIPFKEELLAICKKHLSREDAQLLMSKYA